MFPSPAPATAIIDREMLGQRLRDARKRAGLTLTQIAAASGMSVATISRAERGLIALSYEKFGALARTLRIDLAELFGNAAEPVPVSRERFAATLAGQEVTYLTDFYRYGMLLTQLPEKHMTPMIGTMLARDMDAFPQYIRHPGEEFAYVLSGEVEIRFETGRAERFRTGDSFYFDSGIGHVYLSIGAEPARVLVVCTPGGATPG